jgi:hypothetical protein
MVKYGHFVNTGSPPYISSSTNFNRLGLREPSHSTAAPKSMKTNIPKSGVFLRVNYDPTAVCTPQ